MTAAVIFDGNDRVAVIRILDKGQGFDESLDRGTVNRWMKKQGSMFKMGM